MGEWSKAMKFDPHEGKRELILPYFRKRKGIRNGHI